MTQECPVLSLDIVCFFGFLAFCVDPLPKVQLVFGCGGYVAI